MRVYFRSIVLSVIIVVGMAGVGNAVQDIQGKMKLWYPVILTFEGPTCDEAPETFRNYRLDVTFTHGCRSMTVPGYFAADGDAANTSATSGNKWRVKFTPDATGHWHYQISFRMSKHQLRYPVYDAQLGNPDFQAAFAQINEDYHEEVLKYVKGSAEAGFRHWRRPPRRLHRHREM